MMTTKDFVQIANAIAAEANKRDDDGTTRVVCHNIASNIAELAAKSNPRFDRARFMRASGFSNG